MKVTLLFAAHWQKWILPKHNKLFLQFKIKQKVCFLYKIEQFANSKIIGEPTAIKWAWKLLKNSTIFCKQKRKLLLTESFILVSFLSFKLKVLIARMLQVAFIVESETIIGIPLFSPHHNNDTFLYKISIVLFHWK